MSQKGLNDWHDDYERMMTQEERTEIDFRAALLKEIINRRFDQGLSQRELAEKMGVKHSVVARFESGVTDPRLSTIARLFDALGLELLVRPAAEGPKAAERIPIPAGD